MKRVVAPPQPLPLKTCRNRWTNAEIQRLRQCKRGDSALLAQLAREFNRTLIAVTAKLESISAFQGKEIKTTKFSETEDMAVLSAFDRFGPDFTSISDYVHNRTPKQCKARLACLLKKKESSAKESSQLSKGSF